MLEDWLENPDWLRLPTPIAANFLFRDNVTLLASREKDGKSTLASYIAACVSSGRDFLGQPTQRGLVLWLRLEEPAGTLFRRLVAFGADPQNVRIPASLPNGPDDIPWLMDKYKPLVTVVDTLTALAKDHVSDPYNSIEWTRIMYPLSQLSQKHHSAVLVNHHSRKSDGKYRDSTAIGANADHILEMSGEKGDDRVRKFTPRGRWEIEPFRLRFEDDEYRLADAKRELDALVMKCISARPGCNMKEIKETVRGKAERIHLVVSQLLQTDTIRNLGNGKNHEYWLKTAIPAAGTVKEGNHKQDILTRVITTT